MKAVTRAAYLPRARRKTLDPFVPGQNGVLVSGGLRFFGERLSADVGIGALLSSQETQGPFPLVNFVYTFGKR